jgi:hypothetical protein
MIEQIDGVFQHAAFMAADAEAVDVELVNHQVGKPVR